MEAEATRVTGPGQDDEGEDRRHAGPVATCSPTHHFPRLSLPRTLTKNNDLHGLKQDDGIQK